MAPSFAVGERAFFSTATDARFTFDAPGKDGLGFSPRGDYCTGFGDIKYRCSAGERCTGFTLGDWRARNLQFTWVALPGASTR